MDNKKIGQFISELRKSNQMTQKDLSVKLNITDKAVSKWERGLSYPDISLLPTIADVLGVTISELLNGEKNDAKAVDESNIHDALEYGVKITMGKMKMTQNIWAAVFSFFLLCGIIVVSLIDLMISDTFTWSLIPISVSAFAWLVFFPAIKFGMKGIIGSLINISIFLLPLLYVLDHSINSMTAYHVPIFSMGISIAPLLIVFTWAALFLFKKLRARKLLYSAVLVLLFSPITFLINLFLDVTQGQGQTWFRPLAMINAFIPVAVSMILFILQYALHNKKNK